MRIELAAALSGALLLAACAQPHQIEDRQDYIAEATRSFPGETRERVISAAQVVLKLSDPSDFDFRYTLDGFVGLRRYFVYAVLASQQGQEKWQFVTRENPGAIDASVSISEAGTVSGGYSTTPFERAMNSIPLYRLFWSRVEYVLGRRSDWVTCDEAAKPLGDTKTNIAEALGGLCGSRSNGRDAPPPAQMAPMRAMQPKTSASKRR
jgi:hypothetical protein